MMIGNWSWCGFLRLLRVELRQLMAVNASDRRWQMPLAAALASGCPLLVGAYFDRLEYGLISSLGGLVFLYLPNTPLHHRMVSLMACAFGMTACFTFGTLSHFYPLLLTPVLTGITILVTMICRFYRLGPPGSLFFVMASAIGAYSSVDAMQVPLHVGLMAMGCLMACAIAFIYSLIILRIQEPQEVAPLPPASFDFVVFEPVMIGLFTGISLASAQLLQLDRAYWVPVSCLTVMQGMSLRAVWNKQVHRIVGTAIGLLLSLGLLALPLDKWTVALMVILLSFIVETAVVRHYGVAVIFITPLTLFLAEAATLGHGAPAPVVYARFWDTVLGCVTGLVGGACLHNPLFRRVAGQWIRSLIPGKLLP